MDEKHAQDIISQTRKVYNTIAPEFSGSRTGVWNDMKYMMRYAEDGDTVLDLGCGNGRLYQLLRKKQVGYIGVDQADQLIAYAKKQYPGQRFLVAEMQKTNLQDNVADVIFNVAAFHHLPSERTRIDALLEMKRLTKPGGLIVLLNWNLYSNWAREKGFESDEHGDFYIPFKIASGQNLGSRYYHGFLLEELHDLAEKAGLKISEQFYMKEGNVSSIGPGDNILTVLQ